MRLAWSERVFLRDRIEAPAAPWFVRWLLARAYIDIHAEPAEFQPRRDEVKVVLRERYSWHARLLRLWTSRRRWVRL